MRASRTRTIFGTAGLACAALLAALPAAAQAGTFFAQKTETVTIDDDAASPYPSTLDVAGATGSITDVDITLFDFSHTNPDDVDVAVQAPNGSFVRLMSDACGSADMTTQPLKFSDEALGPLDDDGVPACTTGTYVPVDYPGGGMELDPEAFVSPGPSVTDTQTQLSTLDGSDPNGTWKLFIQDDTATENGQITGWRIDGTTTNPVTPPPTGGGTTTAPGNPTSSTNPAGHTRVRKCKKKKRSASAAKRKKCKRKK